VEEDFVSWLTNESTSGIEEVAGHMSTSKGGTTRASVSDRTH